MGKLSDLIKLFESLTNIFKNLSEAKDKHRAKKDGYFYSEYTKHITIYPGGHGILICSYAVRIVKKEKCKKLYFKINLDDAKKGFKFNSLQQMSTTKKSDRFTQMGFWYESENNFLTRFKEFYWKDENREIENPSLKASGKNLRWYFSIDQGKIEDNQDYKFTYVISIPGMFPLSNGKVDKEKLPYADYQFSSSCHHDVKVNKMTYIVSFDDEVELTDAPKCEYHSESDREGTHASLTVERENNCLYQKYVAKRSNLGYNNVMLYTWEIGESSSQ